MAEKLSKSQLEAKKVAELKEIASDLNLDIKGLKKSQIIEAILTSYSSEESEPEIVEEAIEIIEESEPVEEIAEIVEEVIEPEKVFKPFQKTLTRPQMMYKDEDLKVPMTNIIGLIEVLEEHPKSHKVTRLISGRGILTGFIVK